MQNLITSNNLLKKKKIYIFNQIKNLGKNFIKNNKNTNFNYINNLKWLIFSNFSLILRSTNWNFLIINKNFHLFFFNNIKNFYLGITSKNIHYNSLKNNFKLFLFSLYKTNFTNRLECNFMEIKNNYFLHESTNSHIFLSKNACIYKKLYSSVFKFNSILLLNKFSNNGYLKSYKQKKFKKKEAEKLEGLRLDLDKIKDNPFNLKFYYKFYQSKRLHPFFNKDEFLAKKFKYFKPNNFFLLHFFF